MRLGDHLRQRNIKRKDFARRIKKAPSVVSDYCNGKVLPRREVLADIFRETEGEVTPNDFFDVAADGERAPESEPVK